MRVARENQKKKEAVVEITKDRHTHTSHNGGFTGYDETIQQQQLLFVRKYLRRTGDRDQAVALVGEGSSLMPSRYK